MRHRKRQHCRKNGGALISALFITAIAAMIATAIAVQERLIIHEGELVINADQSYLNLQGMQKEAEMVVEKYASQWVDAKNIPSQFVPLKTKLPDVTIKNMKMTGVIDDEQGKFNMNDLSYPANQARFIALLQAAVQGISLQQSNEIAKAITTWMTNNSQDAYYLSLHPPYRSSQTLMANISELRLIAGITPDIYAALVPYVTALPIAVLQNSPSAQVPLAQTPGLQTPATTAPESPININSASAPVFLTLDPQMTLAQAQSLVSCRKNEGGFTTVTSFLKQCGSQLNITALSDAVTTSNYFLVHLWGERDHHVEQLNSLLVTQPEKNNKLSVRVVWQEFE